MNPPDRLDLDAVIADRGIEVLICCGSGGVGKTTTSAALALRAAERGRRVVCLTIDPARRLAQSLGLGELDNTPRPVTGIDTSAGGSLDAMMLDMKRTFDEVVLAHSTPEKAQQILANPFYEALSTSFSGTQEYMAMEKLGQLHAEARSGGRWDLIVVDTPPARSALDFLDAPEHLSRLLDGRILKLLLAPAKGPFRLMGVGMSMVTNALSKILGAQVLADVQTFVAAFETLFGGFGERARRTRAALAGPQTSFLVVASPTRDALREATYFVERLREERMPLAGVVINRVHSSELDLSAGRAEAIAEDLDPATHQAQIHALRRHAARMTEIDTERRLLDRFRAVAAGVPMAYVPDQGSDVTSTDDLRAIRFAEWAG
ncbi:ArsA family ATPase [Naumannella cuiyingiana]|uniref:Anion-transporting ArsA/GET3 family ATPase n=1 Tax=Naumannella cuiyingiana TaxID=1347891 RepID=A0A7Z0D9A6_9ACTN|nr:ArsA-related P-loop ATPase [Naumannella cuiyingiana]NYI71350.1 anion-transporting ArsA/GET3 family ATPase [Naumannella cuiyingiana]